MSKTTIEITLIEGSYEIVVNQSSANVGNLSFMKNIKGKLCFNYHTRKHL